MHFSQWGLATIAGQFNYEQCVIESVLLLVFVLSFLDRYCTNTFFSGVTWAGLVVRMELPTMPETSGRTPFLNDKCTVFFYVHHTTHRTYGIMSHLKDSAIILVQCLAQRHKSLAQGHKCLAQEHKCQDRNPNSHCAVRHTRARVRCT